MNRMNRKRFFDAWRTAFGPLTQGQVDGLESLLFALEGDELVQDLRWAAYMLATVYHETGRAMQPVEEHGRGAGHPYGATDARTGKAYYGRGYVQLTWKSNYEAMEEKFGLDFLHEPELVLRPEVSYKIMSYGMRNGSFTGVGLGKYIDGDTCDYLNARRIIIGADCAERISGYAVKIEAILKDAED